MRAFIAVEVPEKQRRLVNDLITEEKKNNLPIRWVAFENLHITMKFLGEIDDKKKNDVIAVLTDTAKRYKPVTATLDGLGCFPSPRNPRVLWVGVSQGDKELVEIASDLENSLAKFRIKKEDKKFHAHLTIGRVKSACSVDDIIARAIKTEPFAIDALVLFKSTLTPQGPVYEPAGRFSLGT
jgi:2'-5' RNA ligase